MRSGRAGGGGVHRAGAGPPRHLPEGAPTEAQNQEAGAGLRVDFQTKSFFSIFKVGGSSTEGMLIKCVRIEKCTFHSRYDNLWIRWLLISFSRYKNVKCWNWKLEALTGMSQLLEPEQMDYLIEVQHCSSK